MKEADVFATLQSVFDDVFSESVSVRRDLTADDVAEWTSLFHVHLVIAIERAFRIRFKLGETASCRNVGELADLIGRKLEP